MRRKTALFALVSALAALTVAPAGAAAKDTLTLGGTKCRLIAVPTVLPLGAVPCPGVRPGARVVSEKGACSFNFIFSGSDGRTYAGTAGHCILGSSPLGGENAGEKIWAPGSGPVAQDGSGNRIGEFAYAVLQDPKDFALVRLDPAVPANPRMCHFGGPTGVNAARSADPVLLQHFGHALGLDLLSLGRTAVAVGTPHPDHVFATGVALPGDSGSGVTTSDGRAVGVLVTLGVHLGGIGTGGVDAGPLGITRLAPQEARAEQVLRIALTIRTAPAS